MNIDQKLFFKINGLVGKSRFLDVFGRIGAKHVVFFIFIASLILAWSLEDMSGVYYFFIFFVPIWFLAFISNVLIGLAIRRPRPYVTFPNKAKPLFRPKFENWKSFPSDHAMTVFVMFFMFIWIMPTVWAWALLPFVLWVCWSRVFCGVHYLGDTIGGMIVALISVLFVFIQLIASIFITN